MRYFLSLLFVAAALVAGCGDGVPPPRTAPPPVRPSRADLMTLVPDGAHVVVRVDLRRFRRFWSARSWTKQLEGAQRVGEKLNGRLGTDVLRHASVLVAALWFDTTPGTARMLLIARGPRTDGVGLAQRVRARIDGRRIGGGPTPRPPSKRARWQKYRDVPVVESHGEGVALLGPFAVAAGPATLVRQAVDLLRAVPGRASAREDRVLAALWKRVAGPDAGKPPMIAAVMRLPAAVRERVSKKLELPGPVHRLGLRISGGSWLTLRAFLDVPGRKPARAVIQALHGWVQGLVRSRLGKRLRLGKLLQPLSVHHEGGRIHVQWALPAKRLDAHVRPLMPVLRLLARPARPAGKRSE